MSKKKIKSEKHKENGKKISTTEIECKQHIPRNYILDICCQGMITKKNIQGFEVDSLCKPTLTKNAGIAPDTILIILIASS